MATADQPLIIVEDYRRTPDPRNGTDELIDGRLVFRPFPGALHGIVCGNVSFPLAEYAKRSGGVACLRCGLIVARNPDSMPAPDVLL